jgi:hypothetical protein
VTLEMLCVIGGIVLLCLLVVLAIIVQRSDQEDAGCFVILVGFVILIAVMSLFAKAGISR